MYPFIIFSIQEELDKAAKAATLTDWSIQSFHNKVEELKRELVAEEKTANKVNGDVEKMNLTCLFLCGFRKKCYFLKCFPLTNQFVKSVL